MKRLLPLLLALGVAGAAERVTVQAHPLKGPALQKAARMFLKGQVPRTLPGVKSPQPDTIAYDDGNPNWGYNWPGMYAGVRFTPLSNFELRAFYLLVYNVAGSTPDSLFFYILLDNGTVTQEPDTADSIIYAGYFSVDVGFFQYQIDLSDSLQFSAGEDFYIFVGPQGGDFGIRTLTFDATGDAYRSFVTSDWSTFDLVTDGDMNLQAGGEYSGAITDLVAEALYADPGQYFHATAVRSGPVTFKAVVSNAGNTTINSYNVKFVVADTLGNAVFTNTVSAGPIAPGETDTVVASASWTPPLATGYTPYVVTDTVSLPLGGEGDVSNNTASLEQYAYPPDSANWFMYSDFSVDALFSWADGNMWAMRFVPDDYPTHLSAIAFYFSLDGNAADDTISAAPIYVYADDGTDGAPGTLLYADTLDIVFSSSQTAGLVTIPVDITLNSGGVVVAYQFHTDPDGSYLRLGKDSDPPIAGGNWYMPYSSFNYFVSSDIWAPDNTGDWFIWALFEPSCTCGDLNGDGTVDPMDLVYMTAYFFQGGPAPAYPTCADVDGSGTFDKADIAYLANYLFLNGSAPACP